MAEFWYKGCFEACELVKEELGTGGWEDWRLGRVLQRREGTNENSARCKRWRWFCRVMTQVRRVEGGCNRGLTAGDDQGSGGMYKPLDGNFAALPNTLSTL